MIQHKKKNYEIVRLWRHLYRPACSTKLLFLVHNDARGLGTLAKCWSFIFTIPTILTPSKND